MDNDDKNLKQIKKLLEEAESKIESVKRILFEQVYLEQAESLNCDEAGASTIVEGVFDGEEMIDKYGRKYQVPVNYCSKSKLIAGDSLKLTIESDGTFIFKQIGPVDRKRLIGELVKDGDNWRVDCEEKKYKVLPAAVTYFKGKADDKATIIIPKIGEANWAAIENIIKES